MDKEEAAPDQGGILINDVPLKNTTCVACGEPTGLRTGTGHHACLECLIAWNPVFVADVADVADTGGKV